MGVPIFETVCLHSLPILFFSLSPQDQVPASPAWWTGEGGGEEGRDCMVCKRTRAYCFPSSDEKSGVGIQDPRKSHTQRHTCRGSDIDPVTCMALQENGGDIHPHSGHTYNQSYLTHILDTIFLFLPFFLGPCLQHMEVPRLGVKSELQLPGLPHGHSMQDPHPICNLYTAHGNAGSLTH